MRFKKYLSPVDTTYRYLGKDIGAMVNFNLFGLNRGQSTLGGLHGFLNGNPLSNQNGLGKKIGLANRLGLSPQGNSIQNRLNNLPQLLQSNPAKISTEKERENDPKKKDRVDLSNFAEDAAQKALENARKSPRLGNTNQIIVSEDGRFEASIDLRLKQDGSFDLGLAVKFAQSSSAQIGTFQQQALPEGMELQTEEKDPVDLSYRSLKASQERYVSYEQQLETRGFQARIFYEEAKSVSLGAAAAHGEAIGGNLLAVSGQVAHEFTLNVSISGESLDAFNQAAEDLIAFDDTGTLKGFLDSVRGVLNSDSGNLGSFLEATQSLIGSTREHIHSKLGSFFTSIQDQHGQTLEDLGYAPNFIKDMGDDVQKDLNSFFDATKNFFQSLIGGNDTLDKAKNSNNQKVEVLERNLEKIREHREELQEKLDLKQEEKREAKEERDSNLL